MLSKSSAISRLIAVRSFASKAPQTASTSTSTSHSKSKKPAVRRRPVESKSFVMNLFRGRPNYDQVFPYPVNLNDDQREMLQLVLAPTEKFLNEVNDPAKNDANASIPAEQLKQFAELGAFGAVVPEEYEGAGLNNTQMARLAEIVGGNDLGLGVVMGAHQSIGYKGILLYGSDEQKKKYLPDLATGKKFACFCLTEPSSGSDANSIRTRAELTPDGKHYVLNGCKYFISNGGFADIFTVFAQTPVKRDDGTVVDKVSAFVVERAHGGITAGPPEKKMGIKGSNTVELTFDNVKVPVENLLGGEGHGFKVAMNILNNGRFGIPAACTGAMKTCIQKTVEHVGTRVQFGKKLIEFGDVQEKLATMIGRHYATESVVYLLASNMDRGVQDYQLEAAIGKIMASENAWAVCDDAIQLFGGMGFMTETGLERVLRDLRIFRIFEGSNDVLRLFVSLTGIHHSGQHLMQVAHDIKKGGIGALFGEVKRRTIGHGDGDLTNLVHPSLRKEAADISTAIAEFGKATEDFLTKHRKAVINRQYELTRLADAAIDIYAVIATLSRATYVITAGRSSGHDEQIVNLVTRQAIRRIQDNIDRVSAADDAEVNLLATVAQDAVANDGLVRQHPVDLN